MCGAGGGAKGKKQGGKVIAKDEDSDIYKVVKMLMEQQYHPVSLPCLPAGLHRLRACASAGTPCAPSSTSSSSARAS